MLPKVIKWVSGRARAWIPTCLSQIHLNEDLHLWHKESTYNVPSVVLSTNSNTFHLLSKSVRRVLLLFPFYRRDNWRIESQGPRASKWGNQDSYSSIWVPETVLLTTMPFYLWEWPSKLSTLWLQNLYIILLNKYLPTCSDRVKVTHEPCTCAEQR